MKEYDVIITEAAQQDLREIMETIIKVVKEASASQVQNLINQMELAILSLEKAPFGNSLVSDERLVTMGIRKMMIDKYIVLYIASEKDKSAAVVRILHDQRHWNDLI
ncbi:MAG: type II toxin-antitoxin system RelE/ParE family toxin [Syntrophomonas sp.]